MWNPAVHWSLSISQSQLQLLLGTILGPVLFDICIDYVEKGMEGSAALQMTPN